mmetsp:Transcript_1482/g.1769  ORF Transcript_1482/g.1769 Transcript_1482/m.1769 type:complete len:82 (-) Transcript_1482:113-358(-)
MLPEFISTNATENEMYHGDKHMFWNRVIAVMQQMIQKIERRIFNVFFEGVICVIQLLDIPKDRTQDVFGSLIGSFVKMISS